MVIEKERINDMVEIGSHLRLINLYPALNKTENLLIEGIKVGDKSFDFCKKDTEMVIKCDDGRIFHAHVNFMEEYNMQGRPLTLVSFGYILPTARISLSSKLENRWMTFGYYDDDVLDEEEFSKNAVCTVEPDTKSINFSKDIFNYEEIDAICKKVNNRSLFTQLVNEDKKKSIPSRYIKSIEKKSNVC